MAAPSVLSLFALLLLRSESFARAPRHSPIRSFADAMLLRRHCLSARRYVVAAARARAIHAHGSAPHSSQPPPQAPRRAAASPSTPYQLRTCVPALIQRRQHARGVAAATPAGLSLPQILSNTCPGCGVRLQTVDPDQPGCVVTQDSTLDVSGNQWLTGKHTLKHQRTQVLPGAQAADRAAALRRGDLWRADSAPGAALRVSRVVVTPWQLNVVCGPLQRTDGRWGVTVDVTDVIRCRRRGRRRGVFAVQTRRALVLTPSP